MHTPRKSFDNYAAKSTGSKATSPSLDDGGRFIPNRSVANFSSLFHTPEHATAPAIAFGTLVHHELFGPPSRSPLLRCSPAPKRGKENVPNGPRFQIQPSSFGTPRELPSAPYKMLDAPGLRDDFYMDLVDWSKQNVLAVALENKLYLWDAQSLRITELCSGNSSPFTSLAWNEPGSHLAVGTADGSLQLYDRVRTTMVVDKQLKTGRLNCLAWNQSLVSAGSKRGRLVHYDVRSGQAAAMFRAHEQEVCGVKWAPDGMTLASGGNDNCVGIWNSLDAVPVGVLTGHTAAVKALDWDPAHNEVLATGGGNSDKQIKLWNARTMQEIASVDAHSQVSKVVFSQNSRELVSAHGYSDNSVMLWTLPDLQLVGTLKGHTRRVLYMALAPDGERLVSGSGDETLRFWKLFPAKQSVTELPSLFEPSLSHLR